ncbi:hypothetical protein [Spirosoma sordidisoli]|uniref:Uncharacterized protein n=1 Tax=Spirosoma sordidisoli TaxID=2502893 RepID=A0A4Q2UKT5_9BACT|nr:hypothetical protein [Spirosoma sordidisoli]RYC69846.1 hypothetical protein EQG79_14740 [Spirosoma sordidisoli]
MVHITRSLTGLTISLFLGLSACTQNQSLVEPEPPQLLRLGATRTNDPGQPRLRLKRTVSTSPGLPGITEFLYDQQGRQSGYVYLGDTATFTYDANDRITSILYSYTTRENVTGEQTIFAYDDAQREVRATLSLLTTINGQYAPLRAIKTSVYRMDGQNQPIGFTDTSPQSGASSAYEQTFAGGNLSRTISQAGSSSRVASDFTYDNRSNPFFGLIGPGIGDMRRFSRNNVLKLSMIDNFGSPTQAQPRDVYTIQYEFNEQGLPTRAVSPGVVLRYEYESY